MWSLICNTVRWHVDVSREGESLWPLAQPSASLLLNLTLLFCLQWSLSSSPSVLPYFYASLCPISALDHNISLCCCLLAYPPFCLQGCVCHNSELTLEGKVNMQWCSSNVVHLWVWEHFYWGRSFEFTRIGTLNIVKRIMLLHTI